jgi:hypothetical protein
MEGEKRIKERTKGRKEEMEGKKRRLLCQHPKNEKHLRSPEQVD